MTRLPLWLRLMGVPLCVAIVWAMTDERGWVMGIVAGLVYVPLAISMLVWDRFSGWAKAHPLLESLVQLPIVFVALALITAMPLWVCAVVGLTLGALLVGLSAYMRHRRIVRSS